MAGYSGTPLFKKLGIKDNHRVGLLNAPEDFDNTLGELPTGARLILGAPGKDYDVIHIFTKSAEELRQRLPRLKEKLSYNGALWISWPKKRSGVVTDVSEGVVRTEGLGSGLVDVKVCAVDETWSGLKFMYRLEDRPPKIKKVK